MSVDEFSGLSAEIDQVLERVLKEHNLEQLVDLESLTCLDEQTCIDVFEQVVRAALQGESAGTLNPAVILQAERWLAMLTSISAQSYFLTPMEKYVLAKLMVIEALLLFFYALESSTYLTKLRALAKLFHREEPDRAVAALICDLFKKSTDTPDTWLSRVRTIYHLLVRAAAFATMLKYRPEALEL